MKNNSTIKYWDASKILFVLDNRKKIVLVII